MAEYNGKELTPELIQKAWTCKSAEELLALAGENGISITEEEAKAYLEEISTKELALDDLDAVAGGTTVCWAVDGCTMRT